MRSLVILSLVLAFAPAARAVDFPAPVTLPALPLVGTLQETRHGELEFPSRGKKEVLQGRISRGEVAYAEKLGADPKAALAAIVAEMQRGGWEVMMRDDPAIPPLASFKLTRDGKDYWTLISVHDRAQVTLVAVGPAPLKRPSAPAPRQRTP